MEHTWKYSTIAPLSVPISAKKLPRKNRQFVYPFEALISCMLCFLQLCATPVDPPHACTPVSPLSPNASSYCINGVYALAKRGNCSFALKVHGTSHALGDSYLLCRRITYRKQNLPYDRDVTIPALMISKRRISFRYGIILRLWWSYSNALRFLVPFVVVIGLCFFILLAVVGVRWHRSQTQLRRRRLSKRQLKTLPIKEFKKGDTTETCAICLEDFADGDKLRLLSCGHRYHCQCVDPWLLKRRKICPICKRKALDGSADDSDSDSADEQATPNESSPLLHSVSEDSLTDNLRVQVGKANNQSHLLHRAYTGRKLSFLCGLRQYSALLISNSFRTGSSDQIQSTKR
ncbi:E3 ubiquitin protein ligase RNF13 [Trichuris trichiura]|uniref:E3 ubiquitin protein ligase RNF13 n=1 Tax=Trichuris trichiura TaxID=36087 RepID=A0A077YZW8_TRITR|nr:E3 ubiquitin protein ligase RNF13 [Trichuris trichiura]